MPLFSITDNIIQNFFVINVKHTKFKGEKSVAHVIFYFKKLKYIIRIMFTIS